MLVLADRGSKGFALARSAAATGAQLLRRMSADLQPPMLHALPDGTYLSMSTGTNERDRLRRWSRHKRTAPPQIAGVAIRVIEAAVAGRAADGTMATTTLRLFTTLLDHQRYPAAELAELYHRRWHALRAEDHAARFGPCAALAAHRRRPPGTARPARRLPGRTADGCMDGGGALPPSPTFNAGSS